MVFNQPSKAGHSFLADAHTMHCGQNRIATHRANPFEFGGDGWN